MKNIILFLLLVLSLASCDSCKKPQPEPETYFNCTINGVEYKSGINEVLYAGMMNGDSVLLAAKDLDEEKSLSIFISDTQNIIKQNMEYRLSEFIPYSSTGYYSENRFGTVSYRTDSIRTGKVTITELSNTKISGTFYFDAFDSTYQKTVHVTNGAFSMYISRQ